MKKIQISNFLPIVLALFLGTTILAQDKAEAVTTNVETAKEMSESKAITQTDIITYLSSSEDFSTLFAALKATGLAEKLSGEGPYTLFAPTNAAFDRLGKEKLDNLLKPENKETLKAILKYHVIVGNADAKSVLAAIEKGNGTAQFKTVNGQNLTASVKDESVYLMDAKGSIVKVNKTDMQQTNGVIHGLDAVVLPVVTAKSNY